MNSPINGPEATIPESGQDLAGLSYEAAMAALEEIVARLESGESTLDESMSLFQKGMALSRICADKLSAIEKQITQLIEKPDGQIEEKPFAEDL